MKPVKCIGLWGRILGHRFKLNYGDYVRPTDFCTRCGLKAGTYVR